MPSNSLSLDNNHLQDILSNEAYIELGNINYKVLDNLLKGKLDPVPDTDGGMWQDDEFAPNVNEYNAEEHPKYNGDTSTAPMQSVQLQEILSTGLDPVVTHADGGIWQDANFTPYVNEYNVTNPVPGGSSSPEDPGTGE